MTTTYLWETMTHIRMMLKNLCLSGMLGIKQSKITWFWGYILLPLLCFMSVISPSFDVKSIIFSQLWPGTFSQNCWSSPDFNINSFVVFQYEEAFSNTSRYVKNVKKNQFSGYNCEYFLTHKYKLMFWVLTRTVSLWGFFWAPTTYILVEK